jgi:hypothetical protein
MQDKDFLLTTRRQAIQDSIHRTLLLNCRVCAGHVRAPRDCNRLPLEIVRDHRSCVGTTGLAMVGGCGGSLRPRLEMQMLI